MKNCLHCGEKTDEMSLYTTKSGAVCWSCFEDYYPNKCSTCHQHCSDTVLYELHGGGYRCEDCLEKLDELNNIGGK